MALPYCGLGALGRGDGVVESAQPMPLGEHTRGIVRWHNNPSGLLLSWTTIGDRVGATLRGGEPSVDRDELEVEYERGVGRHRTAEPLLAIRELGRHDQTPLAAHLHAGDS